MLLVLLVLRLVNLVNLDRLVDLFYGVVHWIVNFLLYYLFLLNNGRFVMNMHWLH